MTEWEFCKRIAFREYPGAMVVLVLNELAGAALVLISVGTFIPFTAGLLGGSGVPPGPLEGIVIYGRLSLLLTPSGAETQVFWVSQPLAWLVAPKDVPLMTRRDDLKLSHGATAKPRENAVKQDRVQTTNAI